MPFASDHNALHSYATIAITAVVVVVGFRHIFKFTYRLYAYVPCRVVVMHIENSNLSVRSIASMMCGLM